MPEFNDPTVRELIVYSYRAIYKVRPGAVHVIGVIHGARDLKKALRGRRF